VVHNTKFIVERQEFKCNGTALAVISSVSRELLFKPHEQPTAYSKDKRIVELRNISQVGFAALVRFAFAQDPQISPAPLLRSFTLQLNPRHTPYLFDVRFAGLLFRIFGDILGASNSTWAEVCYLGVHEAILSWRTRGLSGVRAVFWVSRLVYRTAATFWWASDWLGLNLGLCLEMGQGARKIRRKILVSMLKLVNLDVRFPLMATKYFSAEAVSTELLTQKETLDLFCFLTYLNGDVISSFSSNPLYPGTVFPSGGSNIVLTAIRYMKMEKWLYWGEVWQQVSIHVGTFAGKGWSKCHVSVFTVKVKKRGTLEIWEKQDIWREISNLRIIRKR